MTIITTVGFLGIHLGAHFFFKNMLYNISKYLRMS